MKSIYQKLAITSASAVLGLGAIVIGVSPSLADSSYTFTVTDSQGKIVVSGTFSGQDANQDGWIHANELTSFSQQNIDDPEFSSSHTQDDISSLGSDRFLFAFAEAYWKERTDGRALLTFIVFGGRSRTGMSISFNLTLGQENPENETLMWFTNQGGNAKDIKYAQDLAVWVKQES